MAEENALARYFIAKCDTFENLVICQQSRVWAVPKYEKQEEQIRDTLLAAFNAGPVVLLFSVNGSKGWQGYARLVTSPSDTPVPRNGVGEWYTFQVEWVVTYTDRFRNGLSFTKTEELMMRDGDNLKSVNKARNWEEVEHPIGKNICDLLDAEFKLCKEDTDKAEARKMGYENPVFFKLTDTELAVSPDAIWQRLTTHVRDYGRIMLACPFGSHRYNLHTPSSDLDMFVVYIGDTEKCLSFHPPPLTIKNRTSEQPDFTLCELYRYCELLVSGDPRVVESLFLHKDTVHYATEEYYRLVELRNNVISREVVRKYLSDACGSRGLKLLRQWEVQKTAPNKDKQYKVLYIVMRLLFHARHLAFGEEFRVFLEDESEEREFLLRIRRKECGYRVVRDRIESVKREVEVCLESDKCELMKTANEAPIEAWMLGVRREKFVTQNIC